MIPLFDLHCDTFLELYNQHLDFKNSSLHISLEKAITFSPYVQVCSIWSDYRLSDEDAYKNYRAVLNYIKKLNLQLTEYPSKICKLSLFLGVEDARILNNDIDRLNILYNDGVRILTLTWKDANCIGGGWNTSLPLTPFGRRVVEKCSELGIIVDLSHSSLQVQNEVMNLANRLNFVPIYSHSNSYSVCQHKRNITDEFFRKILSLGGLVGISLTPNHLELNGQADILSILKHIEHYILLGGENIISLGCDFDGVKKLPLGISSIEDLNKLHFLLIKEYGSVIANKIFFKNAYNYFNKNLPNGR